MMEDVINRKMNGAGQEISVILNYLARRAAMPISPQRRTLGDLAVRRSVRVDRR
jgi:hypothetical protein